MQGEGQEFESPRLHHLLLLSLRVARGTADPLISVSEVELGATDQRIAGPWPADEAGPPGPPGHRTFPSEDVIGSKVESTSISPKEQGDVPRSTLRTCRRVSC